MPSLSIQDRTLRSAYDRLVQTAQTSGTQPAGLTELVPLLATVADKVGRSGAKALEALNRPGITRAEQLTLVQDGLSAREKLDLESILDNLPSNGTALLAPDAKLFLEQVVGRATPQPNQGPIQIVGNQAGARLAGLTDPNVTIEVINLSTIPTKRLHADNTFVLGQSDAQGNFSGAMDMKEGDFIRMRTRDAQGRESAWVTIRAQGMGVDTRNAEVGLMRIGLVDKGAGKVELTNINSSRPISEPHAQIKFVNERTGQSVVTTLDALGQFQGIPELPGKAGDTYSVRASDGKNDTAFLQEVGKVTVPGGSGVGGTFDLPDPTLHKDDLRPDGTPKFQVVRHTGPLFGPGGAKATDVKQGNIGDCYLPAALAAVVHMRPGLIETLVKDEGNGKYTVTFQDYDWRQSKYVDKKITVDADLYVRSYGGPVYGASEGSTDPKNMILWWPLVEKAYAAWKGSFDSIGNGGSSSDVMEALMGRSGTYRGLTDANKDSGWRTIKDAIDKKLPVALGTYDSHTDGRFANSGIYGDHAYTVLGYEEKNGVRYVELRNPWGESEPFPGDGKNDGIFKMKLDDAVKYFQSIYSVS